MKKPLQSYLAVIGYTDPAGYTELWTKVFDAASQHEAAKKANGLFAEEVGDSYADATGTRVFPMGPAHLGNAVKAALADHDGSCLDNAVEIDKVAKSVVRAVSRRS